MRYVSRTPKKSTAGFTLVELMIVVGLSGILSLAIFSMLVDATRINRQADLQSALLRDSQIFLYNLEQYLSQVTAVYSCNCGAGRCVNNNLDVSPAAVNDPAVTVLSAQVEEAQQLMAPPNSARCLLFGRSYLVSSDIVARGCKMQIDLVYVPPSRENGTTASRPGQLKLVLTDATGAAESIGVLSNITEFSCGVSATSLNSEQANYSRFTYRINQKSKTHLTEDPTNPYYESFAPGGQNYGAGYHLQFFNQVVLRNVVYPGLHFSKMVQYRNCRLEGEKPDNNDASQCCSFAVTSNGICTSLPKKAALALRFPSDPVSHCAAPGAPPPQGDRRNCCSQMVDAAADGVCL